MKYYYAFTLFFVFNFYSLSASDYIINSFDNHNIHGTLINSKNQNSTIAIIISGSGPTDRDGNNTSLESNYSLSVWGTETRKKLIVQKTYLTY